MKNTPQLKQWLLNKPAIFALMFFCLLTGLTLVYFFVVSLLHFETLTPLYFILFLSFVYSAYYMIKRLPHDKMPQNDFIAITNGSAIISIISSIIALAVFGIYGPVFQHKMMMMYLSSPILFGIIAFIISLISLYVLGVAISGFYAKYKRATTIGISPWRVILSMPFAFLLAWVPGYLIEEKNKKSNLVIKSKLYNRFNNWVLSSFSNILFVFLFLTFTRAVIAGIPTLILTAALLVLYALWYKKHKSDFIKNINNGYALTSIGINIAFIISVLLLS